jgi:AcrR family transcriptional regulator
LAAESPTPGGPPPRFEPAALAGLSLELAMARLPTGRHGLPREFVARSQRQRLVAAMLRLLPQHGYPALTIGHLTKEAGVSRAAFYHQFADKEECFLSAYDLASEWFCEQLEDVVAAESDWRERLRLGAAGTLKLLAANPLIAHLFAVEALQAGGVARARQQAMLDRSVAALRADHPGRPGLPEDLTGLLLGGIVVITARYIDGNHADRLPETVQALVEFVLIPYLGGEATGATLT